MKRAQNWLVVLLCLALVGAIIAGCGGGGGKGGGGNGGGSGGNGGGGGVGAPTIKLELNVGEHYATLSSLKGSKFTYQGFTFGELIDFDDNTKTYDGVTYTHRLKLGGSDANARGITFSANTGDILTVLAMSSSSKDPDGRGRHLMVAPVVDGSPNTGASADLGEVPLTALDSFEYAIPSDGDYVIYSSSSGINIYYIKVVGLGSSAPSPPPTTEPTTEPTPEPTTEPTPEPTPFEPPVGAILYESFNGATIDNFWTAAYKALPNDPEKPMYNVGGGRTGMTFPDGKMHITSGGRFTIGDANPDQQTQQGDINYYGTLDLSRPYKISFTLVAAVGDPANANKKFQVYIDNNTTSADRGPHGSKSKIYDVTVMSLVERVGERITIESPSDPFVGSGNSFIQLRMESGTVQSITIDDLVVEYK